MSKVEEALLAVKVMPKAHKNEIVGWENEELKIKLRAIPEKGKANEALIAFLAKIFGISKSSVQIVSGDTSRHKKLRFSGIAIDELKKKIESVLHIR